MVTDLSSGSTEVDTAGPCEAQGSLAFTSLLVSRADADSEERTAAAEKSTMSESRLSALPALCSERAPGQGGTQRQ